LVLWWNPGNKLPFTTNFNYLVKVKPISATLIIAMLPTVVHRMSN
jgi:hypothetical protein